MVQETTRDVAKKSHEKHKGVIQDSFHQLGYYIIIGDAQGDIFHENAVDQKRWGGDYKPLAHKKFELACKKAHSASQQGIPMNISDSEGIFEEEGIICVITGLLMPDQEESLQNLLSHVIKPLLAA